MIRYESLSNLPVGKYGAITIDAQTDRVHPHAAKRMKSSFSIFHRGPYVKTVRSKSAGLSGIETVSTANEENGLPEGGGSGRAVVE